MLRVAAVAVAAALGASARSLPAPRADFYVNESLTYLNTGGLGASPRAVIEAVTLRAVQTATGNAAGPSGEFFSNANAATDKIREKAAAFINAESDEVCLVPSTTVGINTVADGLVAAGVLKRGEVVLTTDQEHPGGLAGWLHHEAAGTLKLVQVAIPTPTQDEEEVVAAFRAALEANPTTKVISVQFVTNTAGLRLPLRRISDLAHARGVLVVVDGVQGMGAVRVDVKDLGVDCFAASGAKWMLATPGTGLLYVSAAVRKDVRATVLSAGFGAFTSATNSARGPQTFAALGAAIDYQEEYGVDEIEHHAVTLRDLYYRGVEGIAAAVPGLRIMSPPRGSAMRSGILTVELPSSHCNSRVHSALQAEGVVMSTRGAPPHFTNGLRASFHVYTRVADVRRALSVLRKVLTGPPMPGPVWTGPSFDPNRRV